MKLKVAIEVLSYHQEWRLGKRKDMIYEPKKLSEALDVILNEVKKSNNPSKEKLFEAFVAGDTEQMRDGSEIDREEFEEWYNQKNKNEKTKKAGN